MRLIEARTLSLQEFYGDKVPEYAILSHTWGDEEVTFKDWEDLTRARTKAGFAKIEGACSKALEQGLDWVWVDTNCIDKSSSAELSEAINSMFDWYARSEICFVYLADVSSAEARDGEISRSRWFTRGWTLQELVAPKYVWFYAADWSKLGSRHLSLAHLISSVTGIDEDYLQGNIPVQRACIAQKMSWLAKRTTTRVEDMAYCMLGLFDINMPLLYGEGSKAFTRLQHEIIRASNDHTIFCWKWTPSVPEDWTSLLAPSPSQFKDTGIFRPSAGDSIADDVSIYSMTNAGLSIQLPVIYASESQFVVLKAANADGHYEYPMLSCLQVRGQRRGTVLYVSRVAFPQQPVTVAARTTRHLKPESLLVMNNRASGGIAMLDMRSDVTDYPGKFNVVLAFDSQELRMQWSVRGATSYPDYAFDSSLSTLTLGVLGRRSRYPEIGATWIQMNSKLLRREIYIFVAVEVWKGEPRWFCQIFAEAGYKQHTTYVSDGTVLEGLKAQIPSMPEEQPGHYSESLDLSVTIDTMHPLQPGQKNSFLRISKGRASYLRSYKRATQGQQMKADDDSGAESVDSTTAIASVQKVSQEAVPTQGAFRVSHWQ